MEKANDRLSRECMKLQLNEQKTMQQLEDLQGSQDQSKAFERDLEMLQTKLFESGENAKRMALKMDQIVREVAAHLVFVACCLRRFHVIL